LLAFVLRVGLQAHRELAVAIREQSKVLMELRVQIRGAHDDRE